MTRRARRGATLALRWLLGPGPGRAWRLAGLALGAVVFIQHDIRTAICADEAHCREWGHCAAAPFALRCVATDEGCSRSRFCELHGVCQRSEESGSCAAASDEDCSSLCQTQGRCSASSGIEGCIAKRDEQCASSASCKRDGLCALGDGVFGYLCGARDADGCAASEACKVWGRCAPSDHHPFTSCRPKLPRHCRESLGCKRSGLCYLRAAFSYGQAECAALPEADDLSLLPLGDDTKPPPCVASKQCALDGQCSKSDDGSGCVAKSAEDCRRCRACRMWGQCASEKGKCTVGSDEDCGRSLWCTQWGLCHSDGTGCIATDEKDCRSSKSCELLGRCTLVDGACVASADEDCKRSRLCAHEGRCRAASGDCVPPS